jgi:hypothetical protein
MFSILFDFSSVFAFEAIYLLKHILYFKNEWNSDQKTKKKKFNEYYNLYKVPILEKYIFYISIFFITKFLTLSIQRPHFTWAAISATISHPFILNTFFTKLNNFVFYKRLKYIKRKYLNYLQVKIYQIAIYKLDSDLINVSYLFNQEDSLFSEILNYNHFSILIKNAFFIFIMLFLRENTETTYYYYKAIKLYYYANSKYLFNKVDFYTAKIYLHKVFINKDYHLLNSIDYACCIYTLLFYTNRPVTENVFVIIFENLLYYTGIFMLIWGNAWTIHTMLFDFSIGINFLIKTIILIYAIQIFVNKRQLKFNQLCFLSMISLISCNINFGGDILISIYIMLFKFIKIWVNLTTKFYQIHIL